MSRIPDVNEPLVDEKGIILDSPYLFLDVLQRIIDGTIVLFYRFKRFDSLASINAEIRAPVDGMTVTRTDEGLATFRAGLGPSGTWVLASDDTTPIT